MVKYNDFLEVMPEELIKKINNEYSKQKVNVLSKIQNETEEKLFLKNISNLYMLLNKSVAYFSCYKNKSGSINMCCDTNLKHKQIVKSFGCCNDFSIYDGYLVPRYLNFDRCFCDHYKCEMDILKLLLLLTLFKNNIDVNKVYDMAFERLDVINTLVLNAK